MHISFIPNSKNRLLLFLFIPLLLIKAPCIASDITANILPDPITLSILGGKGHHLNPIEPDTLVTGLPLKLNGITETPSFNHASMEWLSSIWAFVRRHTGQGNSERRSARNPNQEDFDLEERHKLSQGYQTILDLLDSDKDAVFILTINTSILTEVGLSANISLKTLGQQNAEFSHFIKKANSTSTSPRVILIYNTCNINDIDAPAGIGSSQATTLINSMTEFGFPRAAVTIFLAGQYTCHHKTGSCYRHIVPYTHYWPNAVETEIHKYKSTLPNIIKDSREFSIANGPTLLFEHQQYLFPDELQSYLNARSVFSKAFDTYVSESKPVYTHSVEQGRVLFQYGYDRHFNKGTALASAIRRLNYYSDFNNKKVYLVTIGSEMVDTSMMTQSMQYPFDVDADIPEGLRTKPLPDNVQFLFSVLLKGHKKQTSINALINRFPNFKPIIVQEVGIRSIMTTVAEHLSQHFDTPQ